MDGQTLNTDFYCCIYFETELVRAGGLVPLHDVILNGEARSGSRDPVRGRR